MKHAIILHNPVSNSSKEDELDVLIQAELVSETLKYLGYSSQKMEFTLNDNSLVKYLKDNPVSIIFNLVETIGDSGRYSFVTPAILELLKVPFTGSGAEAIFLTTDKIVCKTMLIFNKINTPAWARDLAEVDPRVSYMIKPIAEDGSVGIDDVQLFRGKDLKVIPEGYFAEAYIHGREFNISIIAEDEAFQVLPPAEMCFSNDFYENRPRILGYKAKWDEHSMEYQNTTRSFRYDEADIKLFSKLKKIAGRCWKIFGLRGYARVDVRVGNDGIPQVIEVNANPCIAPDSGFVAACHEAGLENIEIIKRIIQDAKQHSSGIQK